MWDLRGLDGVRPRCAVCGREVDAIEWSRDLVRDYFRALVRCHGAVEVVEIPILEVVGAERIRIGDAFTAKPLAASHEGSAASLAVHADIQTARMTWRRR